MVMNYPSKGEVMSRRTSLPVTILLAAIVLFGCSSTDDSPPTTTTPEDQAAAREAATDAMGNLLDDMELAMGDGFNPDDLEGLMEMNLSP